MSPCTATVRMCPLPSTRTEAARARASIRRPPRSSSHRHEVVPGPVHRLRSPRPEPARCPMQSFTHRSFRDPGRHTPPDPTFPLHRQRPYVRPTSPDDGTSAPNPSRPFDLRMPLPSSWPFANEFDWRNDVDDSDEWNADERVL